jgi:regulator of sigma E protease
MIGSILLFLIVLSVLVLVHEFGHYWVAKRSGVWVEEFGWGLPPRAIGKKMGETIYSINWLPFGGFVRLHGETNEEGVTDPKRAFINIPKRKKAAIITAGVVMNFLLAIVCFSISYSFTGVPGDINAVKVVEISEGSPAAESGLNTDEYVVSVNGVRIADIDEFQKEITQFAGEEVSLGVGTTVESANRTVLIVPRVNPPEGQGALGVVIVDTETYFPPWYLRPFYGIYYGFKEALFWGATIIGGLIAMIANLFKGQVPGDLAGPVGIYAITTEAAKFGVVSLINFVGVLSVNLAILNILPFPALDGGRLVFVGLETFIPREKLNRYESAVNTVGMVFLLLLVLLISAVDVKRLIQAGSISGFIDSLAP